MKIIEVGTVIKVANTHVREYLKFGALISEGTVPALEGEVVAVAPTLEEFAELDENFAIAVEDGDVTEEDTEDMVIYYDEGASRSYVLALEDVEVIG